MYYRTAPVFGEAADVVVGSTLRPGNRGPAVADLQRKLNAWAAQSNLSLSPLVEDGSYGPVTAARVRAFQQTVGLTSDGIAGPQTQQQLQRFAGGSVSPSPPNMPRITPSECDRIRKSCELVAKFDFDKSTLRPEHFPIINGIAQCVADSFGTPTPIRSILVIGHTDTRGPDWYNCELGRKRAASVRMALGQAIGGECMARGLRSCPVTMGQILTQSFGEKNALPGIPGDDAQNRRVEVCLFTTQAAQLRPGACVAVPPKPPALDCKKTPQDPRCRRPPVDCSVQSHPDCPPDCVRFPQDPRCPRPSCDEPERNRRIDACIDSTKQCLIDCGVGAGADVLQCLMSGNPAKIAACNVITGGKGWWCMRKCREQLLDCDRRAKRETNCM